MADTRTYDIYQDIDLKTNEIKNVSVVEGSNNSITLKSGTSSIVANQSSVGVGQETTTVKGLIAGGSDKSISITGQGGLSIQSGDSSSVSSSSMTASSSIISNGTLSVSGESTLTGPTSVGDSLSVKNVLSLKGNTNENKVRVYWDNANNVLVFEKV